MLFKKLIKKKYMKHLWINSQIKKLMYICSNKKKKEQKPKKQNNFKKSY